MPAQDSTHILSEHAVVSDPKPILVSIPNLQAKDGWQVRLDREGSVVRVIQVTCSCGEQIGIECEYDSPSH